MDLQNSNERTCLLGSGRGRSESEARKELKHLQQTGHEGLSSPRISSDPEPEFPASLKWFREMTMRKGLLVTRQRPGRKPTTVVGNGNFEGLGEDASDESLLQKDCAAGEPSQWTSLNSR